MRKPDPRIYELTISRLGGVELHECLFVDDNEQNVEAARALGMTAVQFHSNDQAIPEIRALAGLDGAGPR
jgi:putative hydrolase of the HAD superfamily